VDYTILPRTRGTLVRESAGKRLFTAHRSIGDTNTSIITDLNTLRTGDADLRFYMTTVQDG